MVGTEGVRTLNQSELFTVQVDEFWFTGPKSTPNRSESIKTVLEQHNTRPETISELQNEPNSHFQNLDFWTFPRSVIRTAPGWHTSRSGTAIKIKIWALWYVDIVSFFQGSRIVTRTSSRLSNSHTSVIYIYIIYVYISSGTDFFRDRVCDLLLIEKRLRREE